MFGRFEGENNIKMGLSQIKKRANPHRKKQQKNHVQKQKAKNRRKKGITKRGCGKSSKFK